MAYGLILPDEVRNKQPLSPVPLRDSVWKRDGLVWVGSSIYRTQGRLQAGAGPSFTGSFGATQLGREITSDGPALRRGTAFGDHLAYFPGTLSPNGCFSVVLRFQYTKASTAYQVWASAQNYTVSGCVYAEVLTTGALRFIKRGGSAIATSSATLTPGTWYTLAFRIGRSPSESAGVEDVVAYLNGDLLVESTPGSSMTQFVQTGGQSIAIGRDSSLTSLFAVTHAGVDKGELQGLSRNPWQLFEPDDTPVFYSLSSGSSYTDSLSDSAASTDSASTALVALQSVSDSAAATDTASTALQSVNALADSGAATDTATSAHAAVSTLADAAAATDTASSAHAAVNALSDSAAATDSATGDIGAQSYTESLSDAAAASDAIAHAASLSSALADSAAATDAFTPAGTVYTESLTDTAAATDSIGSTAVLLESCADLLAGSDIVVGEGGSVVVSTTPAYRTLQARSENRILRPRAESRILRPRAEGRTMRAR